MTYFEDYALSLSALADNSMKPLLQLTATPWVGMGTVSLTIMLMRTRPSGTP